MLVPPNTNVSGVVNDAVADADTVATILPYLDLAATISSILPETRKIVLIHPPSNISIAFEAVPLTEIVPYVPATKSIVTSFPATEYKCMVFGNVGFFNTSSVRYLNSIPLIGNE